MAATFILLAVVAAVYLRGDGIWNNDIPISPSGKQQNIIIIVAVVLLGVSGVIALFDGSWSQNTWIYYGVANLMFAGYIYVMSAKAGKYYLVFSAIFMVAFAGLTGVLGEAVISESSNYLILINLVEAVEGFGLIWSLFVLGQVAVYSCDMNRKTQTVLFFIVAIVLVVLRLWTTHFRMLEMIGYLLVTIGLLILMFKYQRESLFTSSLF